jgi:hypothetical protein
MGRSETGVLCSLTNPGMQAYGVHSTKEMERQVKRNFGLHICANEHQEMNVASCETSSAEKFLSPNPSPYLSLL